MSGEPLIEVEVAYAQPAQQTLLAVQVGCDATVADAVRASGILDRHPEIPWPDVPVGIFGHKVGLDRVLEAGERVEIYRSLVVDPKERRRKRAG